MFGLAAKSHENNSPHYITVSTEYQIPLEHTQIPDSKYMQGKKKGKRNLEE